MSAAVVLSGGSEISGLAVAEALYRSRIPYHVVSLSRRQLLRGAPGSLSCVSLHDLVGDPERLGERLIGCLADWSSRCDLVAFATEDLGLRCLNEFASDVLRYAEFPRARALRMGGLDKAEFYEGLRIHPEASYLPPTRIIKSLADAEAALDQLGEDVVFKPALKPWDMDLRSMGSKVVTRAARDRSCDEVLERLRRALPLSERWVAQARLAPYPEGERGVWAVRTLTTTRALQVNERWKYPEQGGTACWVETVSETDLVPAMDSLLQRLDCIGLAEAAFLLGKAGDARLVELNTRAWLQVGLGEAVGLQAVAGTYRALTGEPEPSVPAGKGRGWINIERCAMSLARPSSRPWLVRIMELLGGLSRSPVLAIYSTPFPGVRRRWLIGLAATVLRAGSAARARR